MQPSPDPASASLCSLTVCLCSNWSFTSCANRKLDGRVDGWVAVCHVQGVLLCLLWECVCVCVRWNDINFTVEWCVCSQIYIQFSVIKTNAGTTRGSWKLSLKKKSHERSGTGLKLFPIKTFSFPLLTEQCCDSF